MPNTCTQHNVNFYQYHRQCSTNENNKNPQHYNNHSNKQRKKQKKMFFDHKFKWNGVHTFHSLEHVPEKGIY